MANNSFISRDWPNRGVDGPDEPAGAPADLITPGLIICAGCDDGGVFVTAVAIAVDEEDDGDENEGAGTFLGGVRRCGFSEGPDDEAFLSNERGFWA